MIHQHMILVVTNGKVVLWKIISHFTANTYIVFTEFDAQRTTFYKPSYKPVIL